MRFLKAITTLSIILMTTGAISSAISPVAINEPQMVNEKTTEQVMQTMGPGAAAYLQKLDKLSTRYNDNLKNCVPIHFDQYIDLFGLKVKIKFDINGWIDNKCEVKFFGNITSLGKDIREIFDIKATDAQIAAIQPVVECHFSPEQLKITIDAIVAKNKQNEASINAIMESPEKALGQKRELTPEEEKFMSMMMTENVCVIPNKDTLMQQFMELIAPSN